jgi:CBS domain-containing protein
MTKEVLTAAPKASLKEVAETLAGHRISGLPVVDGNGCVVGVISEADIVEKESAPSERRGGIASLLTAPHRTAKALARTAGEAMTSPAVTITPRRDVSEAARRMVEQGVNRLPVLSEAGKLVGIVTRADLVRAFVRSDDEIGREIREEVALRTLWIDPASLEIVVEGGEVTLAGEVEAKADADLLKRFVTRVPGVVSVRSELRWQVDEPKLPRSDPRVPRPPRQ